jgi:hypothetical protein
MALIAYSLGFEAITAKMCEQRALVLAIAAIEKEPNAQAALLHE